MCSKVQFYTIIPNLIIITLVLTYKVLQARKYDLELMKKISINGQLSEETMKNIFEKQVQSQSDIRDFCRKHKQFETLKFSEIQSRLVIDQNYRFAYCQIPKVYIHISLENNFQTYVYTVFQFSIGTPPVFSTERPILTIPFPQQLLI